MYLNAYRIMGLAMCLLLGVGHLSGWQTPRIDGAYSSSGGWGYSSGSSRGSGGFSTFGGGK